MRRTVEKVILRLFVCLALVLALAGYYTDETMASEGTTPEYADISELAGKNIGVMTGSSFDSYTVEYFENPNILYFSTQSDLVVALKEGKIDAFLTDEPAARTLANQDSEITYLEEMLVADSYAFAYVPGSELGAMISAYIEEYMNSDRGDALQETWFGAEGYTDVSFDFESLDDTNGTISFIGSDFEPFIFMQNNGYVGYDVEIMYAFCQDNQYGLEVVNVDTAAGATAILSGKYDIWGGCLTVTEERMESVEFSAHTYEGGVVVMLRSESNDAAETNTTFLTKIDDGIQSFKSSFVKNFITEDRWMLIVEGISVTLLISIGATILGTMVGFVVCFMKLSNKKLLRILANIYVRILQGTPMVVILMIFYYVIFKSWDISGIWIGVIAFGANFGAYVSEMMRTGILAVDKGQIEAAYAIGFDKKKTFVKIVFPQAAKHFLPVYKGEFISLVKTTSIVGYIAIQDLTKMSDIIRSRTFEAFFPLISTAIIYFIITYLLTLIINRIEVKIDPLSRKRIVKGVTIK